MNFALCSLMLALSFGQTSFQEDLKKDAVVFKDGKMTVEGYHLISGVAADGSVFSRTVKHHSEAPASGVISRDNFVAYSVITYLSILSALGNDYKEIAEPIGTVDLEINIFMDATGIQIELKDNLQNKTERFTQPWEEGAEE